jgi:hypothetical protein
MAMSAAARSCSPTAPSRTCRWAADDDPDEERERVGADPVSSSSAPAHVRPDRPAPSSRALQGRVRRDEAARWMAHRTCTPPPARQHALGGSAGSPERPVQDAGQVVAREKERPGRVRRSPRPCGPGPVRPGVDRSWHLSLPAGPVRGITRMNHLRARAAPAAPPSCAPVRGRARVTRSGDAPVGVRTPA